MPNVFNAVDLVPFLSDGVMQAEKSRQGSTLIVDGFVVGKHLIYDDDNINNSNNNPNWISLGDGGNISIK